MPSPSILVSGANRGLGLEFVRQYSEAKWHVHACCRNPAKAKDLQDLAQSSESITIRALDVADHDAIDRLASVITEPLDILLNNAGIYGPNRMKIGQLDYESWREVLEINTLAPVKMAEAFLTHVSQSQRKIIASISSQMGSIAANQEGRHYLYRTSKAALNCATKSLAIDLRDQGITVVAFCPGWVRTDMGGPEATLSPGESIAGMKEVLDKLTISQTGQFINYDGGSLPW